MIAFQIVIFWHVKLKILVRCGLILFCSLHCTEKRFELFGELPNSATEVVEQLEQDNESRKLNPPQMQMSAFLK